MNPALRDLILQSTAFSPTSIPGLALWLDAADASTVTLDGSNNVEQWNDKSGNGRNATQGVSAQRPSYPSNVQNGFPGVLLDGVDDAMTVYANTVNPVHHFMVHRWNGVNRDSRFLSNQAVNGLGLGMSSASSWNISFIREGVAWIPSGYSQGTTTRVYRARYATGNATFWTYASGTETQRQTTATTGVINAALAAGFSLPGHYFEWLVYQSDLTASQIASVESYLATKWGTS